MSAQLATGTYINLRTDGNPTSFGKVIGEADVRDVQEMTASNVGLQMMVDITRRGCRWRTCRLPQYREDLSGILAKLEKRGLTENLPIKSL